MQQRDLSQLRRMIGTEYSLSLVHQTPAPLPPGAPPPPPGQSPPVLPPDLWVYGIQKSHRLGPDKVLPLAYYYIIEGTIYMSPTLDRLLRHRLRRGVEVFRRCFADCSKRITFDLIEGHAWHEPPAEKVMVLMQDVRRANESLSWLFTKFQPHLMWAPPEPATPAATSVTPSSIGGTPSSAPRAAQLGVAPTPPRASVSVTGRATPPPPAPSAAAMAQPQPALVGAPPFGMGGAIPPGGPYGFAYAPPLAQPAAGPIGTAVPMQGQPMYMYPAMYAAQPYYAGQPQPGQPQPGSQPSMLGGYPQTAPPR
eukprot:GAFH01002610.1.p1 GENE.GAFH01002610.1~~GAFH01002610.1.p1  ORF type:complete len:363 (+),score=-14.04 GAFH01002610.1:164-1090(+)